MKKLLKALSRAKPLKGKQNTWQYENLKKIIPSDLGAKEYDNCIDLICDKIKY